jgi:cell division protein FtsB
MHSKEVHVKKILPLLILFVFCFSAAAFAEEKAAKPEKLTQQELLTLKNYELRLQNLKLRLEVMNREIEKLKAEKTSYLRELYRASGHDGTWSIDLDKGIWVKPAAPEVGGNDK